MSHMSETEVKTLRAKFDLDELTFPEAKSLAESQWMSRNKSTFRGVANF